VRSSGSRAGIENGGGGGIAANGDDGVHIIGNCGAAGTSAGAGGTSTGAGAAGGFGSTTGAATTGTPYECLPADRRNQPTG